MMKLLFLNLYPDDTIARYLLSSYVLSAFIQKYYQKMNELEIKILNYSKETEIEKIHEAVITENADIISYSCYVWNINKIIELSKLIHDKRSTVQVFGGPDISLDKIHNSFFFLKERSFFIIGEGERKFIELLKFLDNLSINPPYPVPKGVVFWKEDVQQFIPDSRIIDNLDEIPSIYLNQYIEPRLYAYQQAFLETQRGCRYRCKYCVYHKNNPKISYYSLDRIFKELDYLIIEKKIKALRIFDSIFTSDLERAKEIVRHLIEIKNQDHALPWIYWEFTYNSSDEEFIDLVSRLKTEIKIANNEDLVACDRPQHYNDMLKGYTAVNCVGIQSFSKNVLRAVGRPQIDLNRFRHFMKTVNQYNIVLKVDMILGLPQETCESFFTGLDYLLSFFRKTDHILNIHRLQILPGTLMEIECKNSNIKYSDEAPYYVYSTQQLTQEDMKRCARLSGLLFRIVNSPIRSNFYRLKDRTRLPLEQLLRDIFAEIGDIPALQTTNLVNAEWIDDNYWNNKIYREIPSEIVASILEKLIFQ